MDALRATLEAAGIVYHWALAEEGFRAFADGIEARGTRQEWRGRRRDGGEGRGTGMYRLRLCAFADHMETQEFARGIGQLLKLARQSPTAIMCAEKDPANCHRWLIADYLILQGVAVWHLIEKGETGEHSLDPRARRESGELIYDRLTSRGLGLE